MATGIKPDLHDVHAWGTKGYVLVEGRSKLEPQADPAYFVGYDYQSKGYRMYWPNKHTISTERNVQWTDCGPAQLEGECYETSIFISFLDYWQVTLIWSPYGDASLIRSFTYW